VVEQPAVTSKSNGIFETAQLLVAMAHGSSIQPPPKNPQAAVDAIQTTSAIQQPNKLNGQTPSQQHQVAMLANRFLFCMKKVSFAVHTTPINAGSIDSIKHRHGFD
jgi:hypothetical protein